MAEKKLCDVMPNLLSIKYGLVVNQGRVFLSQCNKPKARNVYLQGIDQDLGSENLTHLQIKVIGGLLML